jgi:branched-subunit amino acid transport protein
MDGNFLPLIFGAALITYGTRFAGLKLGKREVPKVARRFLSYVPIAAFAAIVAPGLAGTHDDLVPRLAAAMAATLVALRFRRLWACIALGMAVFWLTRWRT